MKSSDFIWTLKLVGKLRK